MNEIVEQLKERVAKRADQWETKLVYNLPRLDELNETTILGSYSYSLVSSRVRYLKNKDLVTVGDMVEAPSTVARDYLNLEYKRGPRIKSAQGQAIMDGLEAMPNYAKPDKYDHGFYIDIKSAYWSIMQIVGWNVDYWPGNWLSAGRVPDSFPFPGHKIARNCLVSAGMKGSITRLLMPSGKLDTIKPSGNLTNMSLPKLISDVLNCIAFDAIQMGAVYVNTDGFIVKDEKTAGRVIQLIFDWGLTPTIKMEGPGAVKSSGAYKVGENASIPYKLRGRESGVNAVRLPTYSAWLRKSFGFWAGKRHLDNLHNGG